MTDDLMWLLLLIAFSAMAAAIIMFLCSAGPFVTILLTVIMAVGCEIGAYCRALTLENLVGAILAASLMVLTYLSIIFVFAVSFLEDRIGDLIGGLRIPDDMFRMLCGYVSDMSYPRMIATSIRWLSMAALSHLLSRIEGRRRGAAAEAPWTGAGDGRDMGMVATSS